MQFPVVFEEGGLRIPLDHSNLIGIEYRDLDGLAVGKIINAKVEGDKIIATAEIYNSTFWQRLREKLR